MCGHMAVLQTTLSPTNQRVEVRDTTSTFIDSMSLPIHRWFRYSAGFSASWVRSLIKKEKAKGNCRVFDPFAGSGTVLLEGELCNVDSIGVEAHPFVARIAKAKLCWRESPDSFRDYALSILNEARQQNNEERNLDYPELIDRCFPPTSLLVLDSLKTVWENKADDSPLSELTWLALTSILRTCSPAGTAPWQYVLPKKTKAKIANPYDAFREKILSMSSDMAERQRYNNGPRAVLYQEDARECSSVPDASVDLVITSPPYANNYDYADATRLEMSFWGDVRKWSDLGDTVRKYLIRSCTQHVSGMNKETYRILEAPLLRPIQPEITEICQQLEIEREKHGGKKTYHTMIAAYFSDMAKVWVSLRRITTEGASICFVIGDSAPYGIYVPVDRWLGELAVSAGFKAYKFEKTRDRNVKWKNRKHRIPLHEGHLLIEG